MPTIAFPPFTSFTLQATAVFDVPVTLGVSVMFAPRKMLELGDVTLTEIVGGGGGGATEPTVPVLHPSVDIAASNAVPMFCRQPWILRPTVLAGTSPMPASESKRSASVDEHCVHANLSTVSARPKRESRDNFQACSQLERIDAMRTNRATQ